MRKFLLQKMVMSIGLVAFLLGCFFKGVCDGKGKVIVYGSFYIGENAMIYTDLDLDIQETSDFKLEGQILLRESSKVNLPSYDLGRGILHLQGGSDITLSGYNGSLGSLCAQMNGGNIYLDDDLTLSGKLQLLSGRIITSPGTALILTNSDENAIEFTDDLSNESYIQGSLSRSVIPNQKYFYPIGDDYTYHPMYLYQCSGDGALRAFFDNDIPAQWESSNIRPSLHLEESGAWVLTDKGASDLSFKVGLSALDSYGAMISDPLKPFYAEDFAFSNADMSYQSFQIAPYYVEGTLVKTAGIYSLAKSDKLLGELANTLIVNGRDDSRFKVDLDKFQEVRLLVFDSFGREVFKRNSYNNDFDAQYFRSGTYYYYLTGRLTNGESIVRKDIIEVIRPK